MHQGYLFLRAILLATVTQSPACASRNVHDHVLLERGLHRKKHSVFTNNLPLIILRGGGEQSKNENEQHDQVATDISNESEQTSQETPQETDSNQENDENVEHDPPTLNTSNEPEPRTIETPREKEAADEAPLVNMRGALPQIRKIRHTSDVITDLMDNGLDKESCELRKLIASRAQSYADDLFESDEKLPHPKRVLHYIAPKISAIKHSPDLMLRIQSSRAGIDPGLAACAVGTVARLCELYDRQSIQESDDDVSVGSDIVKDRRFQQLVECVLCGVDVRQRTQEAERMKGDGDTEETGESRDIEEVLDEEDIKIDEGLSVKDACRAAWGIAILGGLNVESFSEVATEDILTALSLRSRELLLARLQLLRQGDTQRQAEDGTIVERLDQDAEELAEDAASAMWVFACVKACTGIRSVSLFEACCSILCQNPDELRQRAQASKVGLDGSHFEENDILERLARSEKDDSANEAIAEVNRTKTKTTTESRTTDESDALNVLKDALLDWLSPNEVTDVLWALALHGSRDDTDSKEETALSETTAAFREIAFDRLVTWLNRDMDVIEQVKRNGMDAPSLRHEVTERKDASWSNSSDVSANNGGSEKGEISVEVVDAASLLSSSTALETDVVKTAESISMKDDQEGVILRQVQVVDAATLLARTPEKVHLQTETKVVMTSTTAQSGEPSMQSVPEMETVCKSSIYPELSTTSRYVPFQIDARMSALLRSGELSFSPHDLCSITWAVTDLRDPLRFLIVDLIAQMFVSLGKESMATLSMGDLSNLAWGIARSATQNKGMSWKKYLETPSATVTRWTTKCALARLKLDQEVLEKAEAESAVLSMLREFHPPELGRLMWSLCFTIANNRDPFAQQMERNVAMSRLAMLALLTAGKNLSVFGTEDLTRISWAFLELCDPKEALSQPLVAESLGRTLSAVESSLLFWESGPRTTMTMRSGRVRVEDSLHFSTFFGRRFPIPLLNHGVNEHEDEDDENSRTDRKLPLLRDLTVDPSSLCKLVSGFSALSGNQQFIEGGWTFLRVAVRLLASKNGQLMEQCPIGDVIRLCHACTTTKTNGREQEQVVHLFARRVVQFMNEALDPDLDAHGKAADRLAHASLWEISILIWSLGELGARHFTTDENRLLAYRKLHLITDRPLLNDEELQTLSAASTANLLHGIVSMNMVSSAPSFVSAVLQDFEGKVGSLQSRKELTDLAETIAKMRHSIGSKKSLDNGGAPSADVHVTSRKENDTDAILGKPVREHSDEKEDDEQYQNLAPVTAAILDSTDRLLARVAETAIEKMHDLSGADMRKLLLVYLLVPFQADDLVAAMEEETNLRTAALSSAANKEGIQGLIRDAADSALQAKGSLSARPSTVGTAIKNGIKAIFGVHDVDEEILEEDGARLSQVTESIHRTSALLRDISERMERVERATGLDTERLMREVEQGAAVELGRCRELIASYRRIDFATGSQGGRCDNERRKDIGKRLLSRLFP